MRAEEVVTLGKETPEYIKEILAYNGCPLFFPSSAVREDGEVKLFFFTDGYVRLSEMNVKSAYDAAKILSALTEELLRGENYYITEEDFIITSDTVYARRKGEDVSIRMVFRPFQDHGPEERKRGLNAVAKYLFRDQLRDYPEYLEDLERFLGGKGSLKMIFRKLEIFKRKMYAL